MNMIKLKTAVLLAGSLKIGAIIGGSGNTQADLVYDFGYDMGMAFQLQDDLLPQLVAWMERHRSTYPQGQDVCLYMDERDALIAAAKGWKMPKEDKTDD